MGLTIYSTKSFGFTVRQHMCNIERLLQISKPTFSIHIFKEKLEPLLSIILKALEYMLFIWCETIKV